MGPQTGYALFKLQKQLGPSEPGLHEFIFGIDAIAKAAGYSPEYFRKRYFDVPASKQSAKSGLPGYHTSLGHYYLFEGGPATHQSSGEAWGKNARTLATQERQARTPGWHGSGACPVSAGVIQSNLHVATSPTLPAPDFTIVVVPRQTLS